MNDLRLNQVIFADSSCYFNEEIIQICRTTLVDAITDSYGRVSIKLGGGHNWGCIPSRERASVIANKEDIRPFIERKIARKNKKLSELSTPTNLTEQLEQGKLVLVLEERRGEFSLVPFKLQNTYSSLSEGKVFEFTNKYSTLKLRNLDNLPQNVFNNLEDAIKTLEKWIKLDIK